MSIEKFLPTPTPLRKDTHSEFSTPSISYVTEVVDFLTNKKREKKPSIISTHRGGDRGQRWETEGVGERRGPASTDGGKGEASRCFSTRHSLYPPPSSSSLVTNCACSLHSKLYSYYSRLISSSEEGAVLSKELIFWERREICLQKKIFVVPGTARSFTDPFDTKFV